MILNRIWGNIRFVHNNLELLYNTPKYILKLIQDILMTKLDKKNLNK